MKVLCVFGKSQYGDPLRGASVELRTFVPAFERNGHSVILFDSWDKSAYRDLAELNRALVRVVEDERPDILFFVPMLCEVWLETLQLIKARGDVISICWTTDDSWKYEQQSRYIGSVFHVITTTYRDVVEKYHRDGIHHVMLTQWAASAEDLRPPIPASECRLAVSFVGAAHGDRRKRIAALAASGVEVACFGHGWAAGPIAGEEMLDVIQTSVISLNFANSQGVNQIKARVFEVPGSGGFLLTEDAPRLGDYYTLADEVETFKGVGELEQKIRRYLADTRRRDEMAARAFERTRRDHTYDVRIRDLIDFAKTKKLEWDRKTHDNIAIVSIDEACEVHRINSLHRMGRALLVGMARAIWGSRRARRAARRIVYELSWRLVGRKTYSAVGLPGRLFPKD